MKTSVDEIGKNKVRLTVEVPSADVDRLLTRTYRRLAQQVKVPGFRPGKAPKAVIDQRLGKDFVRSEALKEGLPDLYAEAVEAFFAQKMPVTHAAFVQNDRLAP